MANSIPCPNPICTHQFAQAELQAASQLSCPKCGFRMQGRGPAQPKPAAAPVKPIAKPPAPAKAAAPAPIMAKPIAVPAATNVKVAQAIPVPAAAPSAPPAAEVPEPGGALFDPAIGAGPLVRTKAVKKKFSWARFLIVLCIVGFAASVVIVGIAALIWLAPRSRSGGTDRQDGDNYTGYLRNLKNESEKVYKLALPRGEWVTDSDIQTRLGAHVAYKHTEYDFWFALVVKDYGLYRPRDAEMLRIAVDKLEEHFGIAMELAAKAEPGKFGDLASQRLPFRGEVKSVKWLGECQMFFNNGIAYWLFLASPDGNTVQYFAAELPRKNISLLSERKGWREQPLPKEVFATLNGKCDMTAFKGVWEKHPPKNEDENGELLLTGKFLREKDNRKNALLLVFTQEKKDDVKDAMKAVREYLSNKVKNDNENYKITHAADAAKDSVGQSEVGEAENIGNCRGRIIDLKLQFQDEPKRYYLLAVVNEPDICYAILCDCSWESRQIWRQDFLDVLRTFRVKKAE